MVSPTLPTNFNDTDALVSYGKELGIVTGIGFVVPAIVLSLILIFVFVKYCGGTGKTRVEFTSNERYILLGLSIAAFAVCLIACAIGWSYNSKTHKGVEGGYTTLQNVIETSYNVMGSVNDTISDLKDDLLDDINSKTAPLAGNISGLFVPLDGILGVVGNVADSLQQMADLTQNIVTNITAVKADLDDLSEIEEEHVISGVPDATEIPNIDNSFTDSLNSSIQSLTSVIDTVHNLTNNVNDTLNAVSTTVTQKLSDLTTEYDDKADQVLSYVYNFQAQISRTNNSFNTYSHYIIHYSSIRKSVFAAIITIPLILTGVALVGVIFRLRALIRISALFCFIIMFWYFLFAGLNYMAYYTLGQVCIHQEEIVGNALSISTEVITIPGTNITERVSEKVNLLLHCSGNDTLLDLFQFNFLIDDLTGEIRDEVDDLLEQANELNQTTQYQQGLDSLTNMEATSVDLDFIQNSSLPLVHEQLRNISDQLNATINDPAYFSSLQAVNNITQNLLLTNGTIIHIIYDSSNITALNCTADPYTKMSDSDRQDLCEKSATAISLTLVRNAALSRSGDVYGNITDINDRLYGFEDSLPTITGYQNQTHKYAGEIKEYLNQAYAEAASIIVEVQNASNSIIQLIYDGTDRVRTFTRCSFVGDAYSNLHANLCTDVRDSLEATSAVLIVGACMLFVSTVVGMVTSYKIARDFDDMGK